MPGVLLLFGVVSEATCGRVVILGGRAAPLLPFLPTSWFVQCGTSLLLGTTEKLYVRAKQVQGYG